MKLQAERFEGSNAISRHGPDGVIVANIAYTHSVIVPWTGHVLDWPVRTFDELNYRQEQRFHLELGLLKMAHAQRLLPIEQLAANVVVQRDLLGVGSQHRARTRGDDAQLQVSQQRTDVLMTSLATMPRSDKPNTGNIAVAILEAELARRTPVSVH